MTPAESNMGSNPQRQPTAEPFTYWREADGYVLGYLNAYPDHWTQGEDLDDLKAQLLDLCHEFSKDDLPGIRKVDELVVSSSATVDGTTSFTSLEPVAPSQCLGTVTSTKCWPGRFFAISRLEFRQLSRRCGPLSEATTAQI